MYKTKNAILGKVKKPFTKAEKVDNNTYRIAYEDGTVAYRLHDTDVVTILQNGNVVLDSGGWQTNTTKDRINKYSEARLSQKNNIWYVRDGEVFYDGITLSPFGTVISAKLITPKQKEAEVKFLKEKIGKYVKLITKKNIQSLTPNGGDCWFCYLQTQDGQTMGDASGNEDHIISHVENGYMHGSMIVNAMKDAGYKMEGIQWMYSNKHVETAQRAVRKYLIKKLIK